MQTGTVKKEGSQSAMRLCMGSRRGFIARIKVGMEMIGLYFIADLGLG
jgi:hypothetical protein